MALLLREDHHLQDVLRLEDLPLREDHRRDVLRRHEAVVDDLRHPEDRRRLHGDLPLGQEELLNPGQKFIAGIMLETKDCLMELK